MKNTDDLSTVARKAKRHLKSIGEEVPTFLNDIIYNNRVEFATLQEDHMELLVSNGYGHSSFAQGGVMPQKPSRSISPEILNEFNGGGTHSQNPYGGIPQGNGNTVEHGETSFDTQDGKYVFSDRINLDGTGLRSLPTYLMHEIGNPVKAYDRFYFDPKTKEYISDSEIAKRKKKK